MFLFVQIFILLVIISNTNTWKHYLLIYYRRISPLLSIMSPKEFWYQLIQFFFIFRDFYQLHILKNIFESSRFNSKNHKKSFFSSFSTFRFYLDKYTPNVCRWFLLNLWNLFFLKSVNKLFFLISPKLNMLFYASQLSSFRRCWSKR